MLKRYSTNKTGKRRVVAHIYLPDEHKIDSKFLDKDAYFIIQRLQRQGFTAFIVGGAVRDLLLGLEPKDFDIATDAQPNQIKRLFRNSRIIGRRFRLVHVFYKDKIIEVSTFRSLNRGQNGRNNNLYGTIEEDVKRRDFSINALYWDPIKNQVVDYIKAMDDIKSKVIKSLIPLDETFLEDPVRILRAIKYSETTQFKLNRALRNRINSSGALLSKVPHSRLTEELFKILGSTASYGIFTKMMKLNLLQYFLPYYCNAIQEQKLQSAALYSLQMLDEKMKKHEKSREIMLFHLCEPFFNATEYSFLTEEAPLQYTYKKIKQIISPLTPPNIEVEKASRLMLRHNGIKTKQRRQRKKIQHKKVR